MSKESLHDLQLGPCPVQWRRGRVVDLISSIESGVSVNGEGYPARDGEIGVLKVSSVSSGRFDPSANKSVTQADLSRVKGSPLKGHILMSRCNTKSLVGASVFLEKNYPDLCLSDKLWQLIPTTKEAFSVRWLAYSLAFKPTRLRLSACATGSSLSMKNIVQDDLLALPLLIPPAKEQQIIASILQSWESAIALVESMAKAKIRLKQSLLHQFFSEKHPCQKHGGISRDGCRPIGWGFPRTSQLFRGVSRKNHGSEVVLSVTQDQGVVLRNNLDRKINMSEGNTNTYKLVEPGDFIISLRSFQGGLEYSSYRGLVSPAYHVIHPIIEVVDEFYRHYFKSQEFIKRLAVAIIGIRDGKQVCYDDFSFMRIPLPHIEEQRKIAATLDSIDREIALLTKYADALSLQMKALMQKLLTGQIRVKV